MLSSIFALGLGSCCVVAGGIAVPCLRLPVSELLPDRLSLVCSIEQRRNAVTLGPLPGWGCRSSFAVASH
ncbi:hypothetical protein PF005_g28139 [Phytophthora fragariae]|uniref:RxLR effector protein n=1 Tax=Phytophthora fragariae TaxID=53985 RepID=A0A6A4B6A8_9STRA|nr:hypothetical protein PF003_g8034 [Phytophthora fragariae]KAE8920388.1 hypothetical protein PF009_g29315 [Phytophthora fragariae]KAE8965969.1 hypothetical protein PF011_g28101 [Phytophthora fragariae]KAE9064277.1 hypothetical protein PF010_g28671 [Phytophthora fragariae]KAE9075565.1 hypothetical protein PF006_g28308 [Phytophthora fragariae]